MKSKSLCTLVFAVSFLLLTVQAQALSLTPSSPVFKTGNETSTSQILTVIDPFVGDEVYKANVGGPEEGPFAQDYTTVFSNTSTDPSDAVITWDGPNKIACPECFLLVKDGNHDPAWYLFDLGNWNGEETITLSGFWPGRGAISHVSIFAGEGHSVPEPATMLLFGTGLIGLVGLSRRKTK